ncbi:MULTISPECIES: methyltransferase [Bacillus]|uniref:Ubiquinone/menaquinone biosynthesis C-methylase UbiE n=1 Tax=Bacillus mycoides TaxID=1405 RepID=A0A3D9TXB8_BACMY|nr:MULTISPECIES: methyltransferase [Bacillus]RBP25734.1 ubiquinone/menaquinone biosynthesis C-methylase UbiE [Bacillus sp. DB-2]REF18384.1 ubiquinone/menaquinone biosynthesis C-methylase UbiE [Bacillus mycoides]
MNSQIKNKIEDISVNNLLNIATGFWASKALASAVELEIFNIMPKQGINIKEVTKELEIQIRPAEMLLTACTALGLLTKKGELYYNSPLSNKFLVKGEPYYFGGVITMLDKREYIPWSRLTEAIKTDQMQVLKDDSLGIFESISVNPEEQRIFTEGMHSWSIQTGKELTKVFDFSQNTQLLDVGGCSGAYCIEAVQKYPDLHAVVFDLAPALKIAKEKIEQAELSHRIKTHTGDFFKEELPKGSDVILLSMLLQNWSPEENHEILQKCYNVLPEGGSIIISELMIDDDKTGPISAALMSLNMLIETIKGRNYSWSEYEGWLKNIGFIDIQRITFHSPGANGILVARKP